jgi:hypothetical protein
METVCPETLKFVKERLFHYSCKSTLLQCTKLLETFFTNICVDNYLVNVAESCCLKCTFICFLVSKDR